MKRLCVYCGSSLGKRPEYSMAANVIAHALVQHNIGLVYGGASIGIMGELANTVTKLGGNVVGVMPRFLVDKEVSHSGLSQLIITDSMHQRKSKMAELSDGFIALPGGFGTFEELFEIITWAQLGFHNKPCGMLNILGYFNHLLAFIDTAVQEGFIRNDHKELILVEQEAELLVEKMMTYESPVHSSKLNMSS